MTSNGSQSNIPLTRLSPAPVPDPPAFAGWRDYPLGMHGCNVVTTPTASLGARLTDLSSVLFSKDINLRIIDVDHENPQPARSLSSPRCTQTLYDRSSDVEDVLKQPDSELPRIRIISLHSAKSPLPLAISESLMRKTLTRYQVDPALLPVLFSFGDAPHLAESGSTNLSNLTTSDGSRSRIIHPPWQSNIDKLQDISYQIRYTEENHRSRETPWSVRQTGVYHHHSASKKFDLFIVLNPLTESVLERQLLAFSAPNCYQHELQSICSNPYRIHILPFAQYTGNWRWYFRYLGDEFEDKNDQVMTLDLKTSAAVTLNFDKVQGLRDLEDAALSLSAFCKGSLQVIEEMQGVAEADFQGVWSLKSYKAQLSGYVEDLSVLNNRIKNTIDLFAYALDLKNQYTAADTNSHVSRLSEATTHDTAAVKWITYLTLLYLPGSFVATLYGMNLFVFDQQTRRLMVAQDFWIYIVTWLPLTFLTFLGYGLLVLRHRPDEESRWHWLNKPWLKKLKGP